MNTYSDSVRVVLFNLQNLSEFLILSETDDPQNFKLPGGKFESKDETPDSASSRELHEELGLEAVSTSLAGELVHDDGLSRRFIYTGIIQPTAIVPSDEIFTIRWVTTETIPETKNLHHILSAVELARNVQK